MPKPSDLPESLKALCYRNAIRIDPGQDFGHHVDRLIRETDEILSRKDPRGKYRRLVYAAVAAVPLLLAVVGSLYFPRGGEGDTKVPWLKAAYAGRRNLTVRRTIRGSWNISPRSARSREFMTTGPVSISESRNLCVARASATESQA